MADVMLLVEGETTVESEWGQGAEPCPAHSYFPPITAA